MLGTQQLSGMLGDILGLGQIPYPDRHFFFVFHFWGVEEYSAFFLVILISLFRLPGGESFNMAG